MSGRETTKARGIAQLDVNDDAVERELTSGGKPFTRYYCIQLEGRERFPYGIAGPFKSAGDARDACQQIGNAAVSQGRSGFALNVYEGAWFGEVAELPWDERFEQLAAFPTRSAQAIAHSRAAA
ncbi:hypothetical protein PKB_5047 [Pseudomonas knackmussii B13]|uniref:Uncharacterized protein n=1 Tax=Pseudomonas knackmussii (strain DSM 6978 / CCUG 54928 / LMG 23759 / B13) TaxID=1301098 RepID=A0A024HMS0_PSEKB|nr:hypothetical protein [Pseudomonas knackmussii]CDF86360.1 hypothetical protein PKB_5047 [Pseudomonas knackmussii B13]